VLGRYPHRADAQAAWTLPWPLALVKYRFAPCVRASGLAGVREQQRRWQAMNETTLGAELRTLRAQLARGRDGAALQTQALGCAAAAMQRVLGRDPYDTQLRCAEILLGDRLAEMATGEGKTLAVALAAAVAALAGTPVHVMTANDYLVARDAQTLAPFFDALGLQSGRVLATSSPAQRHQAYRCDVTYCTAREVAFDYLRDGLQLQAQGGELRQRAAMLTGVPPNPLLLRGLCMAIVDEADSLLVDEATMPLILAEAFDDPAQRAACFQALSLARRLQPGADVQVDPATHEVHWSAQGEAHLEEWSAGLGGGWLNRAHRLDLAGSALVALHALEPDRHYLVRDARVELLDAVTGRVADGRVWSRGLQTMVELKEGCAVSPSTRTNAQISYQRFFARYLRLAGTSGTLAECRNELAAIYGKRVVTVPLRLPDRRQPLPHRVFESDDSRARAVLARVKQITATGRPVLVGCDSVAATRALSARFADAGLDHRVLDARHDAEEAAIVERAGQRNSVTLATAMAGRGTDIELGEGVAALGGLHVLCCQDNASARLDRQFIGRCARQGDPGSAEVWRTLPMPPQTRVTSSSRRFFGRRVDVEGSFRLPGPLLRAWSVVQQRAHQTRGMRQRRRLLEQDLSWQTRLDFKRLRA
jgi:preprotein translocase subunit SecA